MIEYEPEIAGMRWLAPVRFADTGAVHEEVIHLHAGLLPIVGVSPRPSETGKRSPIPPYYDLAS